MTDFRSKLLATQLALVAAICYFFFFFGLGAFGLTGADEPRYAQIAREMLARHDWIVPTLNGSPWLEKPALLYWKMMNSYAIFG
ncbi:MAG TPA: glycosyltransferase family 39 protein, partial [Candidatus Angelobacter sp.]